MIQWLKDLLQPALHAPAPAAVRALPGETLAKQLALVIDLNVCVGCHACVTSCKQWNTSGSAGPLARQRASKRASGGRTSAIGRWCQAMPWARTCGPSCCTSSRLARLAEDFT